MSEGCTLKSKDEGKVIARLVRVKRTQKVAIFMMIF
jgi:hypothetical protein